ncbi:hypothetical protein [Massilia putida]|uniref:hypothetical protein n=1 Tax=Massilia putida TaxID=1141883 RepID=UPI00095212FB|nr:hypothetical protein [Massilia putida]
MADPLDRHAQLVQLGDALQAAAARADWDRLGEQARALIPALRALAEHGPWNATERTALEQVRARHSAAAAAAAVAARALESRLDEMRANKEGWIAYAMFGETELGPIHE